MLLRVFSIFIFVSCILNSFAQENPNNLNVDISTEGKNFKEIIQHLESKYDVSFSYSDNILPQFKLPAHTFSNISLIDLIDQVFVPHGINYQIIATQIVLSQGEKSLVSVSGFVEELGSLKQLIGATIYIQDKQVGSVTNGYGFYSIKLPVGYAKFQVRCLGYHSLERTIYVWGDQRSDFKLPSKLFTVDEILVNYRAEDNFIDSPIQSLVKFNVESLQELPGLFGENDALRNLSLIPGIQSNEMSTGSVYVRGGSNEQTSFLMDEATIYNPSHFGSFFSVFNPDVVNSVSVYKSELPNDESGPLSSLIDVRLREGDLNQWKVRGGIGLISARLAVEGPIVKDKASVLVAFRRSFVDHIAKYLSDDELTQQLRFYFYDANAKFYYRLNDNNRFYISGYTGSDSFDQFSSVKRTNSIGSARWNHVFRNKLFSNTSFVYSNNIYSQTLYENNEEIKWRSNIDNFKLKIDFIQKLNKNMKFVYGFSSNVSNIVPYRYQSFTENVVSQTIMAETEQMMLNSVYFNQDASLGKVFGIGFGLRISHLQNSPFIERDNKYAAFLFEPNIHFKLSIDKNTSFKGSYNHREQPMHQLYINMLGIAVNRWMPANSNYKPQKSDNLSLGLFRSEEFGLNYSAEFYYRKMSNLIETLQETKILYADDVEKYLHRSEGSVRGIELSLSYKRKKGNLMAAYDYNDVLWTTDGINSNDPYQASHARKHNVSMSGVYKFNKQISISATWRWSSGLPFTPATGKYVVDNKVYIKYDENNINTAHLPNYHRLDLSCDIAAKNNDKRRWKSYWNFSIYNAYFRKNVLGVLYFSESIADESSIQTLDPNFYYLYQFVPSVSYRFSF